MARTTLGDLPHAERCTGRNSEGGRCKKARMTGINVCNTHGGQLPAVKAKSLALKLAGKGYGNNTVGSGHPGANPVTALALELRRTSGNIEYLEATIADMTDQELVFGTVSVVTKRPLSAELEDIIGYESEADDVGARADSYIQIHQAAGLRPVVDLYLKERSHLLDCIRLSAQIGFAERHMRMVEAQVQTLNSVLEAVLKGLGHDVTDPEIRAVVREQIGALSPTMAALI